VYVAAISSCNWASQIDRHKPVHQPISHNLKRS